MDPILPARWTCPRRHRPTRRPLRRTPRGGAGGVWLQREHAPGVRDRYREAYADELGHWQRGAPTAPRSGRAASRGSRRRRRGRRRGGRSASTRPSSGGSSSPIRNLEATWLFLERGDATLIGRRTRSATSADATSRCGSSRPRRPSGRGSPRRSTTGRPRPCRTRSSRSSTSSASSTRTRRWPPTELRFLRELLRRELGDVRAFISQLRPPLLDELGLDGALRETRRAHRPPSPASTSTPTWPRRPTRLRDAPADGRRCASLQEALQNVRKHAAARRRSPSRPTVEDRDWVLEVRDDGRGFDVGAVAARGRRNFGLQFMRERAELIGARFDVRSRPDGGHASSGWRSRLRSRGEQMSAIDYGGPDRRRGGPDRRALGEIDADPRRRRPRPLPGRDRATSSSASPTSRSSARPRTAAARSTAPSRPRPTSS